MTRCATRNSLPSLFFQLWEEKISLSPRPRDPGVIASLRELNFKTRTRWWITWQAIFLMAILSSLRELCEKGRIKKIVQGWAENKKSKSLMNRMTSDILLREFSKKKKKQKKELNTPRTFLNERFNHSSNYWYEHFINKLPFLFVRKKKKRRIVGEIFCDQKINTKDDTFHRRIISIKVEKYINYRRTSHYCVSQISRGKIESKQGPINRNGILEIEPRNRILDETEQARRKTSVQG